MCAFYGGTMAVCRTRFQTFVGGVQGMYVGDVTTRDVRFTRCVASWLGAHIVLLTHQVWDFLSGSYVTRGTKGKRVTECTNGTCYLRNGAFISLCRYNDGRKGKRLFDPVGGRYRNHCHGRQLFRR